MPTTTWLATQLPVLPKVLEKAYEASTVSVHHPEGNVIATTAMQ